MVETLLPWKGGTTDVSQEVLLKDTQVIDSTRHNEDERIIGFVEEDQ